ncbi:uncharacterized protein LOC129952239 [Eupeodes corollae]|uniref:uncharacterized protein LOC129952239 n=1 Tax=Eupeodes corollae TaxID=290404 RepID=UPI0024919DA0|nr:uncharacterized protein LOC129952239 [Eupeodes corollae]
MNFKFLTFMFNVLLCFSKINCDMMPIIRVEMNNAGFHRDLQYTIEFDYPLAGKDCELYLEQKLPAAVYVNVDQLDDLKRLKKLDAIYPKFVDVELPTEKAKEYTVLLHGAPKITENLKLPIHFRYHSPGDTSFVNVEISTPEVFMRCPGDDLTNYDELLEDPNNDYCLTNDKFILPQDTTAASASAVTDSSDCDWKLLKKTTRLKAPLIAKIPIGDAKSFQTVLYATILISWIASIWFVYESQSISRKINYKLENQRILDKKYN